MIPLFKVAINKIDALARIDKVFDTGYIGEGQQVKNFEFALKPYIGDYDCLAVSSGTAALQLALRLAGVGYGDVVLSTPVTCLATNMAILAQGAIPYWIDCEPNTGLMDVADLCYVLDRDKSLAKRAKAIMTVDYGGQVPQMDYIQDVANKYNLPIIADACQSIGSSYKGHKVGTMANFTCLSFQAIKYLTTGDGGLLVVKDREKYELGKKLRWFGLQRDSSLSMRCMQDPPEFGYKMQMNDISAALGLANLSLLDGNLAKTRKHASKYIMAFSDLDKSKVDISSSPVLSSNNYWLFVLLVDDPEKFEKYMAEKGVMCSQAHSRNDTKTIFKSCSKELTGVDIFYSKQIAIPVGWWLTDNDVNYIINCIRSYSNGK